MKLSEKQRAEVARKLYVELQPSFNDVKGLQNFIHKLMSLESSQKVLEEAYSAKGNY